MIRGYFESEEWPYREKSSIKGEHFLERPSTDTKLVCVVDTGVKAWGCILWILVALVSFGTALAVWLYWWFIERESFLPQVEVNAYPESFGVTRVTVRAEKPAKKEETPEFTEPVAQWIQRELVENRRASERAPRRRRRRSSTLDRPAAPVDPAEQIRRLAELRDSGALTEEEFEAKKKDLLDRM